MKKRRAHGSDDGTLLVFADSILINSCFVDGGDVASSTDSDGEQSTLSVSDNEDVKGTRHPWPRASPHVKGEPKRQSREEISYDQVESVFHLTARDAAAQLGIGVTKLKMLCRLYGMFLAA